MNEHVVSSSERLKILKIEITKWEMGSNKKNSKKKEKKEIFKAIKYLCRSIIKGVFPLYLF